MLSKGWNRDRLLNVGENVLLVAGCVAAAYALAWLVRHYG